MNTNIPTYARVLVLTLVLASCLAGPAAAQTDQSDEDDGGTVIVELDAVVNAVDDLIDELQEFTGNWGYTLQEVLTAVLFKPFRLLAQKLLEALALLLLNTPSVHPNPAVEEVHREVLMVTFLLSSLAFTAAGILYMIGPILGISYSEVRQILPRVLLALVFSTVSLPLLQLGVELSDALVVAFAPQQLTMSLQQLAGLSVGLVIVWVVQATLLLALAALFIIRNVYILFVAAISPLLALMWSLPRTKRYADTFIAGWFAALLIAPLDMLVLKFSLAMMQGAGATPLQSVSNWIIGVGSLTLLLLVPQQVWNASQTAVGQTRAVSSQIKKRVRNRRKSSNTGIDQDLSSSRWDRDFTSSQRDLDRLNSGRRAGNRTRIPRGDD
jgi:hypothetical protein